MLHWNRYIFCVTIVQFFFSFGVFPLNSTHCLNASCSIYCRKTLFSVFFSSPSPHNCGLGGGQMLLHLVGEVSYKFTPPLSLSLSPSPHNCGLGGGQMLLHLVGEASYKFTPPLSLSLSLSLWSLTLFEGVKLHSLSSFHFLHIIAFNYRNMNHFVLPLRQVYTQKKL